MKVCRGNMNRLPIEFECLYSHFSVTDTVRTSHTQSQDSVEVYQVCVVNSCYFMCMLPLWRLGRVGRGPSSEGCTDGCG